MNDKLQALFLALVLVVMMVGEGESFLGNGQNVGKKRAILKEVEVWKTFKNIKIYWSPICFIRFFDICYILG